jgi:hypothetical protein
VTPLFCSALGFLFVYWNSHASIWFFFLQGGIDNGLLRGPKSGLSSWMTTSDGEAAVAFMHILLGCFVGTCCFRLSLQ